MSRPSTIVIVGAGPYGLSVAAHLRRQRLPFRIRLWPQVQQRLVPEVEDTRVLALHRSAHGSELQTATGELLAAKSVVVAVGINRFRHIPRRLAHLPRELVSHTSHHQSLAAFSGRTSRLSVADIRRERPPRWPVSKAPTSASSCASPGWSGTAYPIKSLVGRRSGYAVRRLVSATAGGCQC